MRLAGGLVSVVMAVAACGGIGQASSSAVVPVPAADAGPAPAVDGGSSPDAGTADAGPSDAGPTPDGGGGISADCEGLVPSDAGPGFILDLDRHVATQLCHAAIPDEGGSLPLYVSTHDDEYKYQTTWSFYRAFDSTLLARREWDSELVPSFLLTHPEGFTGLLGKVGLFNIGHAGDDLSHIVIPVGAAEGAVFAAVPQGGTVVFSVPSEGAGDSLRFQRFDPDGELVADSIAATVDSEGAAQPVSVFAGVSVQGDTLVVFGPKGRPCRGVWLDGAGRRVSALFAPRFCGWQQFVPLLDGSLVVQATDPDGNYFVADLIGARATEVADAPPWLAGARALEFFLLPRSRGYAVRRSGNRSSLELFSPAGHKCGEFTTPDLEKGPVFVGRDGTLVEQDLRTTGACTFRWYPQLFR